MKFEPLKNIAIASSIDGFFVMLSLTNISYLAVSVTVAVPAFAFFTVTSVVSSGPNCAGIMKPLRNR